MMIMMIGQLFQNRQLIMHYKQKSQFFDEHSYKLRPQALQLYNNQSSLEESPISNRFREDSDHSPQPYLYPESLHPFNHLKNNKVYDIKQKIVDLLSKLKDWLHELCLTDACTNEVSEQLDPIISQIKEGYVEESADSCWFSCLPQKKNPNSLVLKESQSNYPYSILVGDKAGDHNRYQSMLIHQSREKPQVWLISENQKQLVKIFFKKYYRLLENSLLRINRYSGEKKLKFLLETNIRNIFSETLRISYDLKLIEYKLKEERTSRVERNKLTYVNLVKNRIEQIFMDRGGVRKCFKTLRSVFVEETRRDHVLVNDMLGKMGKLSKIYTKNKQSNLQHFTYKWRENAYRAKTEEDVFLVDCIRTKIELILSDLVDFGERVEEFSTHWRCLIQRNLNSLCYQLFEDEDCFFLDLQEMLNQRYSKREKHISLIEFLSQAEPELNQSNISRNRSFLNDLTLDELRTCLLSGQIHKNDKSEHNLLLIPIKAASGIFFVRLESSNSSADSRMPMRLSSFRCLLRIVQLITPILQDLVGVCKRLEFCWHQVQKNNHYSILLKQFLKMDLLKSQEGHMQMQCKHSEIQINSNRLQSSSQVANAILERCGIDNLMIYHCGKEAGINEMPCIVYGNQQLALSQKYIIQSIYEQLVSSGKKVLIVNRNGQFFNILPLEGERALVHYTSISNEKIDNQMISQCLVPLLLRGEGKMSCQYCKIELRLPKANQPTVLSQPEVVSNDVNRLDLSSASKLVTCRSIIQLETECSLLLRKRGSFFFKMIYKLDLSDLANFYSLDKQGQIHHHVLKESERIIHTQMFIEDYSTLAVSSLFAKIAYGSPCFDNPQLHIYQNQNNLLFKLVAIPIKNNSYHYGYFLAGFYQADERVSEENIAFFQSMVSCLNLNHIFKSIKLDNQQLLQHYRSLSQRRNQQIERMVFQHLRQSNGKFTQAFNETSSLLLQHLMKVNDNKNQICISSFKFNKKSNIITPMASTKPIKRGSFEAQQEVLNLLDQNYLTFTHQKLMSNQCKLKRDSFNRTIKPIKLQKLNNISIFLPNISQQSNEHLFAMIDKKYKLKGLVANEYCTIIEEIDHRVSGESCKGNQMYVLMRVGSDQQRNESYFVMLQQQVPQGNDQPKINEFVAEKIHEIFAKMYRKSKLFQSGRPNKKYAIEFLELAVKGRYNISQSIKAFSENWMSRKERAAKLAKVLEKFIPEFNGKNIKYYSLVRYSFDHINAVHVTVVRRYQIFLQRILPTVKHFHAKMGKRQAFKNIYNSIQDPLPFAHVRSITKIHPILQKQLTSVLKYQFAAILSTSEMQHHNKAINKNLSAFRINHIITSLQKKHHYHYFFTQVSKAFQHFVDGFQLIAQEYQHIQFSSRQSFVTFANERFQTLLQHIGFGSVESIEVGAAQLNGKQLILYKPDSDKKIQEVVTSRPQTFQPQAHNNFHFVPIKIKVYSSHFLLYRIKMKEVSKLDRQAQIVRNAIISGMVPSYKRYLESHLQRGEKLCLTLLNIACKEMWNGAVEEAQGIYIFGKGNNYEEQCMKIRALSAIKHTKRAQMITQLKLIRNAINQETKQYYRLQYEHNSISNALFCGIPQHLNKQEAEIFDKYGDFITKDKLRQTRENTEKMQEQYERKSLQYQIKSKTFATSKIIMYYEKKEKTELQNLSRSFLTQTNQNQDSGNTFEKAIVQGKIDLSSNRDKLKKVHKKQKLASARSIYLLLSNCNKAYLSHNKQQAIRTILWPRQRRLRA